MNPMMVAAFADELQKIAMNKDAGWVRSLLGMSEPGIAQAAKKGVGTTGAVLGRGMQTQLARGRNFGGAAVDPFVKMRQQAVRG
jgi:hypothetical protein